MTTLADHERLDHQLETNNPGRLGTLSPKMMSPRNAEIAIASRVDPTGTSSSKVNLVVAVHRSADAKMDVASTWYC